MKKEPHIGGCTLPPVVGRVEFSTWIHRVFGFGAAFVPAEGFNMDLYGWAKIRPRWYWRMQWLRMAVGFVWRQYEDGGPRWSWQDAKEIAYCVYPELRSPNPTGQPPPRLGGGSVAPGCSVSELKGEA